MKDLQCRQLAMKNLKSMDHMDQDRGLCSESLINNVAAIIVETSHALSLHLRIKPIFFPVCGVTDDIVSDFIKFIFVPDYMIVKS